MSLECYLNFFFHFTKLKKYLNDVLVQHYNVKYLMCRNQEVLRHTEASLLHLKKNIKTVSTLSAGSVLDPVCTQTLAAHEEEALPEPCLLEERLAVNVTQMFFWKHDQATLFSSRTCTVKYEKQV